MRLPALVFLIWITEKSLCFEAESAKDEAVFQGKCDSNLCAQLCYELHDGMFECDCTQGYELDVDGYTCKANNISFGVALDESKSDSDYSASDVFYQKGILFSAKLEDANEKSSELPDDDEILSNDIDNQRKSFARKETKSVPKRINNTSEQHSLINIPRFYQNSWVAFRPLKGANLVTEINIEFRPESSNGILLISGERDDFNGDFMLVSLNNGVIEFIFDCGSGKGVIKSSEKVVLHHWNSIVIYRYRWDAWLELNEKRRNRGRSLGIFSRITFRTPVFLGGKGNISSETLSREKVHTSKGLSGCIRKFIVNGHQYELSKLSSNEIISTSNLNECSIDQCSFVKCLHGGRCESNSFSCLCPLGFGGKFCENKLNLSVPMFNGSSNLRFSPIGESAVIWLELKLVIRPSSGDGLVLFSGKGDLGDFISIHLNLGFVEFTYDLGSGLTSVKSKVPLTINQWHEIKISRTARLAVLKIDHLPEIMAVSTGFWRLSLPFSLYLGGVSKSNILPSNMRGLGFFVGCIKLFEMNDRKVELIDDATGGFNIANCNETCPENFEGHNHKNETSESSERTVNSTYNNKNKYAFDVVDDTSVYSHLSNHDFGPVRIEKKEESINATKVDSFHNRIVRVSLQKPIHKDIGMCFGGNETYVIRNIHKVIKRTEKYQNNVNIRFRTQSKNGLLFLVSSELSDGSASFFSLSIESGFMNLRYNYGLTIIDIKCVDTKVNDGLWHRVRAMRKNQKGTLIIDGFRSFSNKTKAKHKVIEVTPGLYLGGIPDSNSLPAFNGCISDVILNGHHLDLNSLKTRENVNSIET